jgi:hypothetical protein
MCVVLGHGCCLKADIHNGGICLEACCYVVRSGLYSTLYIYIYIYIYVVAALPLCFIVLAFKA